jgi:phosphohistidine phosphatase
MPRLILVRHAKAVDRMDADDDFDRGLTPGGREDAARTASALKAAGVETGLALVSPAQRAMQTFVTMRETLGNPKFDDPMTLYHASPEMLFRAAIEAFERAGNIMIVGHNPGIGALALSLAERAGQDGEMPDGFPTSAAAVFTTDDILNDVSLDLLINPKA